MELIRLYASASAASRGNLTAASDDFFRIHMFTTNWVCSTFAVQYIGNYLTVNSVNWQKFTEFTVSWHGDNYVQCWLSQCSSAAPILYYRLISSTILVWTTEVYLEKNARAHGLPLHSERKSIYGQIDCSTKFVISIMYTLCGRAHQTNKLKLTNLILVSFPSSACNLQNLQWNLKHGIIAQLEVL